MIADARQVLDAAAADHDDGVLLQIVAFAGTISRNFHAVRQADTSDLTQSRVRLFRGHGRHLDANAALERSALGQDGLGANKRISDELQSRRLGFALDDTASFANELIDGRHVRIKINDSSRLLVRDYHRQFFASTPRWEYPRYTILSQKENRDPLV